jgi:hypothetical protein
VFTSGEHAAGVLVRGDGDTRLEAGADDPQPLIEIDLQELDVHAFEERHEWQVGLGAMDGAAGFLKRGHAHGRLLSRRW